jgi:type II secretory pathway component PulF
MAVFAYKAIGPDAAAVNGMIVADTPRDARDSLRSRGLTVHEVRAGSTAQPKNARRLRFRTTVMAAKVVAFLRELSTLLGVGIPLVEAIDTIKRQHRDRRFGGALLSIREHVSAGGSLADAMRQHPALFDDLCVNITEVGESTGTLDASLERVAEFRERSLSLRNKLGTVLLYPSIVLMMAVGVSILLMTVVVPNLLGALIESGRELPWPTRVVKFASDLIVSRWWLLIAILIAAAVAMRIALAMPRVKLAWHRAQLRLPIAGELLRKQAVVRMSIILSTLLRSGVVFVRALELARRATPNLVLADALRRCEEAVVAGRDIGAALADTQAFSPVVVQVMSVGQQSGRLEEMLERLAADYDKQVNTAAQRLTALLEPALILVLVVIVGFVVLATILPMLEAANAM